ncbi:V-type ATP synthase subunit F [Clostridium malenominatum]|uniref:V-type ATP synthase subunit F n=1 Tax=Clostridium malenominatum TaxID=1539 RepID=A0ABN1IQS9_9CLOT
MKMYLISDNIDTIVGLKISGIDGEIVNTKEEALECINKIVALKDIGIIVVTEKVKAMIPERISELKLSKYLPLIIQVPDRHGNDQEKDWILHYIKEAIGIRI